MTFLTTFKSVVQRARCVYRKSSIFDKLTTVNKKKDLFFCLDLEKRENAAQQEKETDIDAAEKLAAEV